MINIQNLQDRLAARELIILDAEGFYVPIDFPKVLYSTDKIEITGEALGSSQQLLKECEQLAGLFEIPEELTAERPELWDASANQGNGQSMWQRYGTKAYCCVALREACRTSLQTGAALAFT